MRSASSGPSSNSQGGDGTELATVLVLGASLSPSVSVYVSVSVSDSAASDRNGVAERERDRGGGDIEGCAGVLVVGVREVTSQSAPSELRWPASGRKGGSGQLTEDVWDGNRALAGCVPSLPSREMVDGSGSGMAFTGKKVMLNFLLGGVGTL